MKKSLKCCISCILPCGALDVIRVIHPNGRVQEFSETIQASDIIRENPKHVLRMPTPPSSHNEGVLTRLVMVPPETELQRGKIYFLMPATRLPEKHRSKRKKNKREFENKNVNSKSITTKLLISDQYLNEILSEKTSMHIDRRRGRTAVWRPHLESISETPTEL